ncbi:MAG: hypothetical protein ACKOAL_13565, partial [Chthoniobacterales bacterium]
LADPGLFAKMAVGRVLTKLPSVQLQNRFAEIRGPLPLYPVKNLRFQIGCGPGHGCILPASDIGKTSFSTRARGGPRQILEVCVSTRPSVVSPWRS